ncbi:alpha kinase/elongation factor 2 kinase [Anaeramoeba flamelloides]|uniref:Alpha kinase/elongation factor 2 kinase n=1 Tax=Anaeramoeba flamelloides TaxID=1746091 RepID=A0ABQ8Y7P0_9EUKA|nr:alpha kinase/elongation factor 2 kinase [Anaeramoeba flamelloides]
MNNSDNNKKIICAIDFGTSRTGAAWMISIDNISRKQIGNSDVYKVKLDPKDDNFKTSTAILFKKTNSNKWEPFLFGKSAESKYLNMKPKEMKNYQFFKYFKMELYKNNSLNLKIQSYSGEEWEFTQVLSGVFKFIHQKFVDSVNESDSLIKLSINNDTTQWVLTVPAIWEDKSKEIMRSSFHQAGLIKHKNSPNLLFCYEPEVAAIDFFQDQKKQLSQFNNKNLLVIDAGGGTIDITLVKPTIDNDEIKEFEILMVPEGGDFGSIYIDQEFQKFFQSFLNLNDNQFKELKNKCPKGFLKLSNQWESLKMGIQIKGMTEFDYHLFEIPRDIRKYLKKNNSALNFEALTDQFNQRNRNSGLSEIEWEDDDLEFFGDRTKSFFQKPIQKLRNYLNNLKQTSEIFKQTEIVFFTGGLSNSDYFRESVKKQLGNNYQYCKSPYPDKSILIGAVLFGFDPNIVSIRRSQYTYGIITCPRFNPEIHDKNRKTIIKNDNNQEIERCNNVFDPYIFKGDVIRLSEPISTVYRPVYEKQKVINFQIVRTTEKWDPKKKSLYIDNQGVQKMGSVRVPFPESNLAFDEKRVEVSFHFATTEFKIFMKYLPDPTITRQLTLSYDQMEN